VSKNPSDHRKKKPRQNRATKRAKSARSVSASGSDVTNVARAAIFGLSDDDMPSEEFMRS
jgi:hypothetical protein